MLRSGGQCGREAAEGADRCAYHRSLEFRGQARAFYLARLSAEDLEALAEAARVEGVDGEIAVLRLLLRKAFHKGDVEAFRRGVHSLCRLLQTRHRLDHRATERLGSRLEAALERLGRELGEETGDPLGTRPQAALERLARELGEEARELGSWGALAASAVEGEEQPAQEREAGALALRYQAGEAEALELLYSRLEVAILAVLLDYRARQARPPAGWEELRERSRAVLAQMARRWQPGVSFLGYFLRTFPPAIGAELRRLQRGGDGEGEWGVRVADCGLGRGVVRQAHQERETGGEGEWGVRIAERGLRSGEGPFGAGDLRELSELERRVVLLRVWEGLPMQEVARQVGVRIGVANKLYEGARGRLEWRELPARRSSIAMRRLVRALHVAAGPNGELPNRDWAVAAAGLKRAEYDELMARLEGAGAIYGRQQRVAGHLAERDAAATLGRVGLRADDGAVPGT